MNKLQLLDYLEKQGFQEKILKAFSKIKRENFIPEQYKIYAYENEPLPIAENATISQPYTIAFMLDLLKLKDNQKILEIGSGSGYVLALINEISKNSKIYGIEIIKELAEKSKKVLKNHENIKIIHGQGSKPLKKEKFDRILISASCSKIPEHLYPQLSNKGLIVASVKNSIFQIKKINNNIKKKEFHGFVFVKLVED
jgi:protein-L-isoaspartate(D-aspartate) O-methyltransferase